MYNVLGNDLSLTKARSLIILVTMLLFLSACQEPANTVTIPSEAETAVTDESDRNAAYETDAYPAPSQIDPAYPGPTLPDEDSIVRRTPDPAFDPDRPVPTPPADKVTLTGFAFSTILNEMLVEWPVFLAEVYRNPENDGAYVFDTASSPYTLTDASGRFIFTNLEPGEYVIVVGSIEVNRYEIIAEPNGRPKVINVSPGELLDLSTLQVELE
jgi:hypothetical protein